MLKKIFPLIIIIFLFFPFFSPLLADPTNPGQDTTLPSPIVDQDGNPATMNYILANMAKLVLGLVGVLALIMFIIGGITWMTSAGNVESVKKGKGILIWSTIGLIICFLAYSMVFFIMTRFIGLSGGQERSNLDPDAQCIELGGSCLDNCLNNCLGPIYGCRPGYCGGAAGRQCCLKTL